MSQTAMVCRPLAFHPPSVDCSCLQAGSTAARYQCLRELNSLVPFVIPAIFSRLELQVEYARGVLRRLGSDTAEDRELAVVSLESAIEDYEASMRTVDVEGCASASRH